MSIVRLAKLASRIVASNVRELPLPYRLTYAVTSRCQARCAMCNIWQKPVQDELTPNEIESLFRQAHHFSWVNLTGGELFQRPDIRHVMSTLIRNCNQLYLLNFPTNGYQTKEIVDTVEWLIHRTRLPRLIVSISMDGPQELHDRIRGLSGCWHNALNTFKQLREKRSSRFSVYLGYTVQAANIGMFDETVQSCGKVLGTVTADDFHFNLAHASGHYYDNADTAALPEARQAAREIEYISALQQRKKPDPVSFIENRYRRHASHYLTHGKMPYTCQAAAVSCFISPAGIVYPCSVFDAPIGSLREYDMNFNRLWRDTSRTTIRATIRNSGCPGCWTPCEAYQTLLANLFRQPPSRP